MATITGLTAARMEAIEAASIVDGEIVAGDLILTKFDGSPINAGSVIGPQGDVGPQGPAGTTDPWVLSADVWTFGAADAPTYTITTPRDVTAEVGIGQRVRLTHGAAVKYFIITGIAFSAGTTTITLYGGSNPGYTLSATAITLVSFSAAKAPLGFPLDPAKWTITTRDTADRTQSAPTNNVWYNIASLSIVLPIGAWQMEWSACLRPMRAGTFGNSHPTQAATLSNANNTESDNDLTAGIFFGNVGVQMGYFVGARKMFIVAVKTTFFLNSKSNASVDSITFLGSGQPTIIRAICAYL